MKNFKPEVNLIRFDAGTAYKIVNGERVNVGAIIAQDADSCCYLDCCDQSIKYFKKDTRELRKIPLDDLFDLAPNSEVIS